MTLAYLGQVKVIKIKIMYINILNTILNKNTIKIILICNNNVVHKLMYGFPEN